MSEPLEPAPLPAAEKTRWEEFGTALAQLNDVANGVTGLRRAALLRGFEKESLRLKKGHDNPLTKG